MAVEKPGHSGTPPDADDATAESSHDGLIPLDDSIDTLAKEALEAARRAEALEKARKERR